MATPFANPAALIALMNQNMTGARVDLSTPALQWLATASRTVPSSSSAPRPATLVSLVLVSPLHLGYKSWHKWVSSEQATLVSTPPLDLPSSPPCNKRPPPIQAQGLGYSRSSRLALVVLALCNVLWGLGLQLMSRLAALVFVASKRLGKLGKTLSSNNELWLA